MTFGQKLQQLRRTRGMSQEDLAGQLSVTRQTISKWELDQSTPDLPYLAAISEFFGVSTDYLIKEQDAPNDSAPQISQADMDALLTKLQRKRPTARQVFFVLFMISLGGIILPTLLLIIGELCFGGSIFLFRFFEISFVFSTIMAVFCGILAAFLTWKERHPPQ